jgi:putative NIF3 family GTP cyclohydrolase 1 type 2
MQRSILMCASAGIAVYSPHTALDSVKGGVNDWLASGIFDLSESSSLANIRDIPGEEQIAGQGRKITFSRPVLLDELVKRIKSYLTVPDGMLPIACNLA